MTPPAPGRSRFGPRWDPETDEVANPDPYDYPGAKRALARASRDQTAAADFTAHAWDQYAEAQKKYKQKLAEKITEARAGYPATVAVRIAEGDPEVCQLRYERDLAEGLTKAADQLAWKATKDRAGVERLIDWSMKVAPDGQRVREGVA